MVVWFWNNSTKMARFMKITIHVHVIKYYFLQTYASVTLFHRYTMNYVKNCKTILGVKVFISKGVCAYMYTWLREVKNRSLAFTHRNCSISHSFPDNLIATWCSQMALRVSVKAVACQQVVMTSFRTSADVTLRPNSKNLMRVAWMWVV